MKKSMRILHKDTAPQFEGRNMEQVLLMFSGETGVGVHACVRACVRMCS